LVERVLRGLWGRLLFTGVAVRGKSRLLPAVLALPVARGLVGEREILPNTKVEGKVGRKPTGV
jgi:hypothetical protein